MLEAELLPAAALTTLAALVYLKFAAPYLGSVLESQRLATCDVAEFSRVYHRLQRVLFISLNTFIFALAIRRAVLLKLDNRVVSVCFL